MRGWLFPYGIWYALAALGAAGAAGAAAAGDVSVAVLDALIAGGVGVITVRSRVRWSRSGVKAVRAEMIRLVDERAGAGMAAWLDRDAHLLFSPGRRRVVGLRERSVLVIDEELLRDVDDARDAGGGKVAVTGVSYMAHPVFAGVMRRADGTTVTVTDAGVGADHPGAGKPWWRGWRGDVRVIRAGLAFADASELAGVVGRFRDAEPIRPAEPEGAS